MDFAQARDVFRAGRFPECLATLQDVVRNDPASPAPRLFLFQVQSLLGQWDRALTQLKVLTDLDPARADVYALYAGAVRGEIVRREVFAGRREPAVPGGAPPWMAAGLAAARAVAGAGDAGPLPADVADLVAR